MEDFENENKDEIVADLLSKLDMFKPEMQEMLSEIAQSGVSIRLDNADANYFENHREEIISYMWKVVRAAKILNERKMEMKIDFSSNGLSSEKIIN